MLEKPAIAEREIAACLDDRYGLAVDRVTFLPLGADPAVAVYHIAVSGCQAYFLKLRQGKIDETSLELPRFLKDRGIEEVIAPLLTRSGGLQSRLGAFSLILYPFIEGKDGYEAVLSDQQWASFGKAMKSVHAAALPDDLKRRIRKEDFLPARRGSLLKHMEHIKKANHEDQIAAKTAEFLESKRVDILEVIHRSDQLAQDLLDRPLEYVLCHSDIHPGNLLITAAGSFYIVDWDEPVLAPKEHDLMYIGYGQGFVGVTPDEEVALFYRGYGMTAINPAALAYYRYEHIVADIAVECDHIFSIGNHSDDRERSFRFLTSNFLPGNTLEITRKSDKML